METMRFEKAFRGIKHIILKRIVKLAIKEGEVITRLSQ